MIENFGKIRFVQFAQIFFCAILPIDIVAEMCYNVGPRAVAKARIPHHDPICEISIVV